MNKRMHTELVNFIWGICNLLRGPYKRNEYRKVILPLTVLRRFDCVLARTKEAVLVADAKYTGDSTNVRRQLLERASGRAFYNTSRLDFDRLLNDPNRIAQNLNAYIRDFSDNVREIMERFAFGEQVVRMDEKNLLFQVIQRFASLDLSPEHVDNVQMGYVFEELIRIGAEQANEEAGEHFTPREVIRLMVSLLLSPEPDLSKSHVVKTIYDPACGTGGMLSVAEDYLREHNREANPILFGQDHNDESWSVCKSDMLIKGENADNIILGDSFSQDGYARGSGSGRPSTFDYMLANPPFGVEWKQQQQYIKQERDTLGCVARRSPGCACARAPHSGHTSRRSVRIRPRPYSRSIRPPLLTMRWRNACSRSCGPRLLVLKALHPVLGVLAEEFLERAQQLADPQRTIGAHVPRGVVVDGHLLGGVREVAGDHLSVDGIGDGDRTAPGDEAEVAHVLEVVGGDPSGGFGAGEQRLDHPGVPAPRAACRRAGPGASPGGESVARARPGSRRR